MIDSCKNCKTPCCQIGPGPYEVKDKEDFLEDYEDSDNYNKKCEGFVDGKCKYWGTSDLPYQCRVFVCNVRSFSETELYMIDNCLEDSECHECKCYLFVWEKENVFIRFCEQCTYEERWQLLNGD